jgi:hypothetical protein
MSYERKVYYPPPLPKSLWGQANMYGTHRDLGKGGG